MIKLKNKMNSILSRSKKTDSIAVGELSYEKTVEKEEEAEQSSKKEGVDSTDRHMLNRNSLS
jgi:hypothetical protein